VPPFFIDVFADRIVNTEKLQGGLMILSAVTISVAPYFASPDTWVPFVLLLLTHAVCFMPNLGLSNTIRLKYLI